MSDREEIALAFSNGTEFESWYDYNCCKCRKYNKEKSTCLIEQCLWGARINNGKMRKSTALAIGFDENGKYPQRLKCFKNRFGRKKGTKNRQLNFLKGLKNE